MKKFMADLPTLTAPVSSETLTLYLVALSLVVSSVLIADRNGVQMTVYFVSIVLQGGEVNYTPIEKLILSLVQYARRLRRYF